MLSQTCFCQSLNFRYCMILICTFLLTSGVEYLFIHLLAVWISFFPEVPVQVFIYFFNLKEFCMYSEREFFVYIFITTIFFLLSHDVSLFNFNVAHFINLFLHGWCFFVSWLRSFAYPRS